MSAINLVIDADDSIAWIKETADGCTHDAEAILRLIADIGYELTKVHGLAGYETCKLPDRYKHPIQQINYLSERIANHSQTIAIDIANAPRATMGEKAFARYAKAEKAIAGAAN
jgi:hypothetical protein